MIEIENEKPDYLNSFGVRMFFVLLCTPLMAVYFDPVTDVVTLWDLITYYRLSNIPELFSEIMKISCVPVLIYEGTSFYLAFDLWLNIKRLKKWFYQGKDSGWLDKLKVGFYIALKILSLVGLIYSLIKIL